MNNNNFDDLEFIDLDELDTEESVPVSGTANEVNYNVLINDEDSTDNINMGFVNISSSQSDEEDNDEDIEAERRRRRAARERAEKRRRKKKQLLIRRAVFLTALVAFIVSGVLLIKSLVDYAQGDKIYDDIQDQIFITDNDTAGNNNEKNNNNNNNSNNNADASASVITSPEDVLLDNYDHNALIALNDDAVGYLQIPAINILLPVVQGDDNEYYLTHTLTGETNKSGTLFIDYLDTKGIESQNTIIYGHDMKNGSMFGQLDKFMDSEFFSAGYNKYFYFYIGDKIYKYEIYSVHITPAIGETYSIIFPTGESFLGYYNNMVKASYHKTDLAVTTESKTMTLSTCTNDDTKRLVVQAVRVEEFQQ